MPFNYIADPTKIEQESFRQIRALTQLDHLSKEQQQVVMRVVHSSGIPELAAHMRFSKQACEAGLDALANNTLILCDVEMVNRALPNA